VLPFRINRLVELYRHVGMSEKPLHGLLRLYRDYFPEHVLIPGQAMTAPYFRPPDTRQALLLETVRARVGPARIEAGETPLALTAAEHGPMMTPQRHPVGKSPARKRRRLLSAVPEAVTTTRIVTAGGQMQRTLTEASSIKMLAENLERLLLPDQLAVVLTNRKLQHVLSLVHKRSDLLRIEHWLRMRLSQSFMSVARTQGQLDAQAALLDSLVSMSAFFQEMPQVAEEWLVEYLPHWDGETHARSLLALLPWLRPMPFAELRRNILLPLRAHLICSTEESAVSLLHAYARLLERWASIDWARALEPPGILTSPRARQGKAHFLFHPLDRDIDYHRWVLPAVLTPFQRRLNAVGRHSNADSRHSDADDPPTGLYISS